MARCCQVCASTEDLKACGGCKLSVYCSVGCQRADRQVHEPKCRLAIEISRTKLTMFACGKCGGPTRIGDYTCKCLVTFCSAECRENSSHVIGGQACNDVKALFTDYINAKLAEFSRDEDTLTDEQIAEYGIVLYMEARFIDIEALPPMTASLARTMYVTSAKLGCKSSIIRVGNFTDEELVDAHKRSLVETMRHIASELSS